MDQDFLYVLTHGADLQALADLASEYLDYPLVVRNYARDTLCCSKNYPMDDLEDRQNRHSSLIRQTGKDDNASLEEFITHMRTGKPYIRMYPYLRRARMFCGCVHDGTSVGYVMLPGTDKDYDSVNPSKVEYVASIFASALVLNGHPCRVEQDESTSLLWDLLRDKSEPPVPRLSLMHHPFNGLEAFRLFWIPEKEKSNYWKIISMLMPCWYVEIKDGCVILVDGSLDIHTLERTINDINASVGASSVFKKLTYTSAACKEAKTAYNFAHATGNTAGIHNHVKYEILHLVSQTLRSNPAACSVIHDIIQYDKENDTKLLPTLHDFFECGMDLRQTAEKMNIHRNTVSYRLNKLHELFKIDLNNPMDISCIYFQMLYLKGIL